MRSIHIRQRPCGKGSQVVEAIAEITIDIFVHSSGVIHLAHGLLITGP